MKILVIPDSHADCTSTFSAADQIGQAIVEERPEVVVHLGDMVDLDSLSSWEELDERSYKRDIKAGLTYQKRLFAPMKKAKKKQPRRILLGGNHDEYRVERYLRKNPNLRGFIDFHKDFKIAKYWDEFVSYEGEAPGILEIEGVLFAHFMASGVLNKPVSGIHAAHGLLQKLHKSCVVGHSHLFDMKTHTTGDNKKLTAIAAGCSFNLTHDWAGQANRYYDRGYLVLDGVADGEINDFKWVSLDRRTK